MAGLVSSATEIFFSEVTSFSTFAADILGGDAALRSVDAVRMRSVVRSVRAGLHWLYNSV
jgi:hypothetical protein